MICHSVTKILKLDNVNNSLYFHAPNTSFLYTAAFGAAFERHLQTAQNNKILFSLAQKGVSFYKTTSAKNMLVDIIKIQ